MELKKIVVAVGMAACVIASGAHAAPVTSLSGTVIPMPASNLTSLGPITQASGIVWSSPGSFSFFGWTGFYGFAANGSWNGLPPMIGTDTGFTTMEYAFSTPLSGVGGLINYGPGTGSAPTISVFDSAHTLIESSALSFSTSGIGEFHGFQESSASIGYFRLGGSFIGLRDLTITTAPVPEPGSYAMMLAGLGLLGFMSRRRKQNEAAAW